MIRQDAEPLQWYQEDFLASHSLQPGSDEARRMTVTSGRKCCELYRKSGPLGSLVRMLLESSAWRSTRCYLTWKASATPAKRLLFRLVPSTPRTEGTGSQLWPTPTTPRPHDSENTVGKYIPSQNQRDLAYAVTMWPTPTAMDAKGLDNHPRKDATSTRSLLLSQKAVLFPTPTARCGQTPCIHGDGGPDLATFVKLIPTPTTGAGMCGGSANYQRLKEMEDSGVISPEERRSMAAGNGGQLNPTWVEWLMGFPLGWTDLSASETPSCHSSSTQSSGQ